MRDSKSWTSLLLVCVALCIPAAPWYIRVSGLERKATAEAEASRVLTQTYSTQNDSPSQDPEAVRRNVESSLSVQTAATIPRIYIQIASENQRARMKQALTPLQAKGYLVPGIENVGARAPAHSEIRYFRDGDRAVAETVAQALATDAKLTATVIKFPAPRNSKVQHLELWCGQSW